ncbi:MAG: hypothetical protein H7256_16765 [Bdellovibrio sp.]|nr:hypothetical protein [Bdellovibrio sp.]
MNKFLLILLFFCTFAQAVDRAESAEISPVASAGKAGDQTETRKLARQYIKNIGLDEKIKKAFESANDTYFNLERYADLAHKKKYGQAIMAAGVNFQQEKEIIIETSLKKIETKLVGLFSNSEIVYLEETSRAPLFKKLNTFLSSVETQMDIKYSFVRASQLIEGETKKVDANSGVPVKTGN